ncbi:MULTISPECIES: hypothetical protein [Cronobacter]|uniref:hypothetical protein n=1 Tax=Cronobacter TaxID=413496 RepID=UPI00084E10B2|nr:MULTISPECIES: hypothetical protein [Cronobacter]EGT5666300.1 hypothetical protein [Cronobacter sakazakii]EGZ6998737.1 hypothetical protein [Cronobacter sakazakii]EGZ7011086.1 hypothetical protein [Cronobacter sakazakii]EGZ7015798.1 hypothetical protein [Cronobacter sakazakii]EGZ7017977.1 hypothetical protein [Cronobacter sakazakii]
MMKIVKASIVAVSVIASFSAMADWQPYKTVVLDGYTNTIPGGSVYSETSVPSGVYRFRIDPASAGVDFATGQAGNTKTKSAALMTYDRTTTTDKTAAVSYYGLNNDGLKASSQMHAFPQGGAFNLFLEDWVRQDDSGSVSVIIEKWKD